MNGQVHKQLSTRAIVLNKENILLLYTQRYDDYSLPGGKLDANEDIVEGLKRELNEETGAVNIHDIKEFGIYEEYRTSFDKKYDVVHLTSYCYTCKIDSQLSATNLESYEIKNGMSAKWVNINEAIEYNKKTLASSSSKGQSLEREIYLLEQIRDQICC